MMSTSIAGAIMIAVPLVALAWALLWSRLRPVFWFAIVLIMVGTGYLMSTGAAEDIARSLLPDRMMGQAG